MKQPGLFSIGKRDLVKGLISTVLMAMLTLIGTSVQSGSLPLNWEAWKPIVFSGLGAGIAYIIKNLFTNSEDKFAKPEPKQNETDINK